MSKIRSFQKRVLLSAFFVLAFAFSAAAQDLQSDLNRSFIKYDLVRIESRAARRSVENGQVLPVNTAAKTFEFELAPRDLRAARYKAEDTGLMGTQAIEKSPVITYKGKISGETGSEVRLTLDGEKVEGYFVSNGKRFFLDPARKFSIFAGEDDVIVYAEGDLIALDVKCDVAEKIESGRSIVTANTSAAPTVFRVIEIATDADFQFLSFFGNNPTAANNEILSVLNMVEGVYERELNLTFAIVYQHTWTTGDPFTGTDRPSLLTSFQNYWNANFPTSGFPRDVAHLFSGKSFALGAGYAYVGVICRNVTVAYGLSGYVDFVEGRYLIAAHELGHNLSANHADTGDCANTIMNTNLSGSTPLTFCGFSRTEITNFVNANATCLGNQTHIRFDFDGDTRADLSIFRPATGEWWYLKSSNGGNVAFTFGNASDRIVPGDYTGDGKTDVAIFRPASGEWFILRSENQSFYSFPFGVSTDLPAPGDFDGDNRTDAAVFRPSTATWFIMRSLGGTTIQQFGQNGDVPVVADYDGDDRDDLAIFRPSLGEWWISRSRAGLVAFRFGSALDKPVPGDYTGDLAADVALFRPLTSEWLVLRSENGSFYSFPFGAGGDVPAPADYDGDGRFDAAIFRPSTATWFVQRTTAGTLIQSFGQNGDKPVPAAFIP